MSNRYFSFRYLLVGLGSILLAVILFSGPRFSPDKSTESISDALLLEPDWELEEEDKQTRKKARAEYFFRMTRDPATNSIPDNIRQREIEYAQQIARQSRMRAATSDYSWYSVGPTDIGGRTRALAIDQRDPNIIIAGGVSGGMWKSVDGGDSWEMTSDLNQNMSVSDVVQDPNNPDTWYYASGEIRGNSASDRGYRAVYRGTGIFKSTDNGDSWNRLSATTDTDTEYNSMFDYVSKMVVSPTTGSLFLASNGFGIIKSTDDGASFGSEPILGLSGGPRYVDIDVASDGTLIAVLSSNDVGSSNFDPGIYLSKDDGQSWKSITPTSFPGEHDRSVLDIAPSNERIFYVFTQKGSGFTSNQGVSFHKIQLTASLDDTLSYEDRSANLPDFGSPVGGVNTQSSYNMVVRVKPDDADFVLLGGTNLFRSSDGFATAPASSDIDEKNKFWIGGYSSTNDVSQYTAHHPDQHAIAFDPTNPNKVWSGHDGALSMTTNIQAATVQWADKDKGYITSQFYALAAPSDPDNNIVVGGTQDNGSPLFSIDQQFTQTGASSDASSGDGSYAAFSSNGTQLYTSSQNGRVLRFERINGTYQYQGIITPPQATGQMFIHPFEVDGTTMYYPATNTETGAPRFWINTSAHTATSQNDSWTAQELPEITEEGYSISTLESSQIPEDILYYAASSYDGSPKIYKAENASGDFDVTEISIPTASVGTYVHDIALNPVNADEALAVMSNYNITGIYHTTDGGASWTAIEGNLTGSEQNPGPSIRSATIIPTGGDNAIYMVGTSTGLYSVKQLDAGNTSWIQESDDAIGHSIIEYIHDRYMDAGVFLGTHGRGIFYGNFEGTFEVPGPPAKPSEFTMKFGDTEGEFNLHWAANTERDVESYILYRGTRPTNLTAIDTVNATQLSYTDTPPPGEADIYYYAIEAKDYQDNISARTYPLASFDASQISGTEWKMVSSPLSSDDQLSWPTNAQIIGFDGTYEIVESMQMGRGYWIKSFEEGEIKYKGGARLQNSVQLKAGWNLIGSIGDTVSTQAIIDGGDILSSTPVKTFENGSYVDATEILPGGGYFIHANSEGTIELRVDTTQSAKRSPQPRMVSLDDKKTQWDQLQFSNQVQTADLAIASQALTAEQQEYFLVPPMAPQTELDVRTITGHRVTDDLTTQIELTTSTYPVNITLKPGSSSDERYQLTGYLGGQKHDFTIDSENPVTLTQAYDKLTLTRLDASEIPAETQLQANYPNPFNPSTTIRYQLANTSDVEISVFNITGRKIQTLVQKRQQPGSYQISFDGRSLSSGTYFIHLNAGDYREVRKMSLIK
ncbi:MAG: T9SS type A sorting domain-containing protein [Bacteroidota bacterium]